MRYAFVNRPAVSNDIIDALNYYKNINPKLAKQFLFRIREAKNYIAKYPLLFMLIKILLIILRDSNKRNF